MSRQARIARNKHIKRTPPRRLSFRRYWRKYGGQASYPSAQPGRPAHRRAIRRKWVREWYHQDRKNGRLQVGV